MKRLLKSIISLTPYRIIRSADPNRFQAIAEAMTSLARRGFAPKVVIDGGANVGDFARLARRVFGPEPEIHMVEPQPACLPPLEALAKSPHCFLHAAALGATDQKELKLTIVPGEVTTGAHVASEESSGPTVQVPVVTLDGLFGSNLSVRDHPLLKLDLQGWELEALKGATETLPRMEVVLIEVSFFAQAYEPSIAALVLLFDEKGFDLHDVASVTGRARDNRARQADLVFVNRHSDLCRDTSWA